MKGFKSIMAAALLMGASVPAMAQFSSSGGASASSPIDAPENYSIFSIGYDYATISPDYDDADDVSTNGVAIQYTSGKKISATNPLYFEWGIRGALGFWSDSEEDEDYDWELKKKLTTFNVAVPLNIAYRLNLGESAVLTPYAGLHLKGNIVGSGKYEVEYDGDSKSETYNMFDKDDVGKDGQWTRFQFGAQIGARVSFNTLHVGVEYGFDFNELCKKTKTSNFLVSVGFDI